MFRASIVPVLSIILQLSLCCNFVYDKKQNVVVSPNYPEGYTGGVECSYSLRGPRCDSNYNVQFLDFDLEYSRGCTKDRLEIGNQDVLCGGKSGSKTYYAEDGVLNLKFVSNFGSGRGFKLLVTRQNCIENANVHQETENLPTCCLPSYNSKHFFITSPDFPNSSSNPSDCVFKIFKNNPNICRLKINFIFLNNGNKDNCKNGFLEVDNKKICGCYTGLKLSTTFDASNEPKLLRFRNIGIPVNIFSGFVAEIEQEDCPIKYEPANEKLSQQNDVFEKALLSDEKIIRYANQVTKEVYFFEAPEDGYSNTMKPFNKEAEDVDISSDSSEENLTCQKWGFKEMNELNSNILYQQSPKCSSPNNSETSENCIILDLPRGYFHSPGYPVYYPGNSNICYRFKKLPGYCKIKMYISDFDLEDSMGCQKDYFLLGDKYRLCGGQLRQTVSTLELANKEFEDTTFVTDSEYCGRGFSGFYEQIACQDTPYYAPQSTFPPITTTSTENSRIPCSRLIMEDNFLISVYGRDRNCAFEIKKYHPDVCKLEFEILNFSLFCGCENLKIKNMNFCGNPTTNKLVFDFDEDVVMVQYQRFNEYIRENDLKLELRGEQITRGCKTVKMPEVPVERIEDSESLMQYLKTKIIFNDPVQTTICGLVLNATASIREDLCKNLLKDDRIIECYRLENPKATDIDQVHNNKLENVVKVGEVYFKEIDCDLSA